MDDIEYNNKLESIRNNRVGRPLKFQSVEELQNGIQAYFDECQQSDRPLTITGLCLALGTTRELLCDYSNNPVFSDAIKQAKEIVANYAEEQCLTARNPAGAIFIAKNHGFTDKQEIDHKITSKIITVDMIGNIDD